MASKTYLLQPSSKEDAEAKLLEAITILKRLRETSILWQTHFGSFKQNMVNAEKRADKFLEKLLVTVEVEDSKILID